MLSALHSLSLTAIAMATGVATLWVYVRFSDQERIDLAKRKIRAQLYALRLFVDEPALIFRAQKQLLIWNGRYLALMARPAVIITIPTLFLLTQLDAVYGHRTLAAGESAIVTAQLDSASDLLTLAPSLDGRNVAVETPAVRLPNQHQVCWRVRATTVGSGAVLLRVDGTTAGKTVQVGSPFCYLSLRRVASLLEFLRYPAEAPLPNGAVRWMEVSYPDASIYVFGFSMHWLIWFTIVCLVTMFALRNRFV